MKTACLWTVAAALVLTACTQQQVPPYREPIGKTVKTPKVNLKQYHPPPTLGQWTFQGEMEFPGKELRVFRYHLTGNPEEKLDISIYPMPPGWSDLPPMRTVSGHYGEIRQLLVNRALKEGATKMEAVSEGLKVIDASDYPVAEGRLREDTAHGANMILLELTAAPPVFVRMSATLREKQAKAVEDGLLQDLNRFLKAQPAPKNDQPAGNK